MDSIPRQLLDRLELCGLTRSESVGIHQQIEKWFRFSGPEWTVQHLKLIKQTILSLKASYPDGVSRFVKTKNHRLVGPFRSIQRLLDRGDRRALQALMVYTNFVSSTLTKAQREKFMSALNNSHPDYWYEFSESTINFLAEMAEDCHVENLSSSYDESDYWVNSRFAPILGGKSAPEIDKASQLNHFIHSQIYRDIYYVGGALLPEDSSWFQDNVLKTRWPKPKGKGPIGRISVIQEPGFKARFIANPNRIVQHALTPLGDFLFRLIGNLPWDCTFDQSKAHSAVQRRLEQLKKVHCYDLTNATDNFPLRTQIELVYSILVSGKRDISEIELGASQLRLFSEIARSTWSFENNNVSWTRGQPLGLYPSFPLFALSHGALLLDLSKEAIRLDREEARTIRNQGYSFGLDRKIEDTVKEPLFFILGDDVIILNDNLASLYEKKLGDLAIPISKSKSIASDVLAEFAGEVIVHDFIFRPVKWRQVSSKSFGDFIKVWGYESIPLLPRHLREVAYAFAEAPEPVGCGFNPKGKPLGERIDRLLDLYLDTFVPPLERMKGEKDSMRSVLQFIQDTVYIEDRAPYDYRMVSSIPRFGRTVQNKGTLLGSLVFEQFLTDRDITEYAKYLVSCGLLEVDSLHRFSDVRIKGGNSSPPDNLFHKLKAVLFNQ